MEGTPLLSVKGLEAGYGDVPVLFDVSIEVCLGEIVAVLGSNGVGKSTLINNISGIFRPRGGSIIFDGQDITGAASTEIVAAGLVQVPEGRRLFPDLSVTENLSLGAYRRGRHAAVRNMEQVFTYFPRLKERHNQLAGSLSGGEQQMLAIGRGMMSSPRLIMFDEPSLGLSPLLVEQIFTLFGQLRSDGLTLLLVEQNLVQSLQAADRGYVIEHGETTISGPAQLLLSNENVRNTYLGLPASSQAPSRSTF